MNSSRFAALTLAALITPSSSLLGARPALASTSAVVDSSRESVLVTGTGRVFGEPDTLAAEFGVETTASTVGEALKGANTAATRMRDALVRAGITKADLQTSNVSINTKQDDDQKVTGYTVVQGLTAKIRELPRAGEVISAATAAGGDAARLNGVSYAIEDDAALLTDARKKAFADARGKAELYAREAGRTLGRVVKVSEGNPTYGGPGDRDKMVAAMPMADSSVPIEPGRQALTVSVTVEWAFTPS
ncbi:SIMPL domain-containing protein [Actinoplanes sp. GCM10030250]|uniref:SIMPL domain-containing protein n=1 Tax=Actinoplanes sp. GCM10030250 TaxID=3273376 RepID=UPI003605C2DC